MDGKPISQVFSDELTDLIAKYEDSGLTNAEAIGVMTIFIFDNLYHIRKKSESKEKPY